MKCSHPEPRVERRAKQFVGHRHIGVVGVPGVERVVGAVAERPGRQRGLQLRKSHAAICLEPPAVEEGCVGKAENDAAAVTNRSNRPPKRQVTAANY